MILIERKLNQLILRKKILKELNFLLEKGPPIGGIPEEQRESAWEDLPAAAKYYIGSDGKRYKRTLEDAMAYMKKIKAQNDQDRAISNLQVGGKKIQSPVGHGGIFGVPSVVVRVASAPVTAAAKEVYDILMIIADYVNQGAEAVKQAKKKIENLIDILKVKISNFSIDDVYNLMKYNIEALTSAILLTGSLFDVTGIVDIIWGLTDLYEGITTNNGWKIAFGAVFVILGITTLVGWAGAAESGGATMPIIVSARVLSDVLKSGARGIAKFLVENGPRVMIKLSELPGLSKFTELLGKLIERAEKLLKSPAGKTEEKELEELFNVKMPGKPPQSITTGPPQSLVQSVLGSKPVKVAIAVGQLGVIPISIFSMRMDSEKTTKYNLARTAYNNYFNYVSDEISKSYNYVSVRDYTIFLMYEPNFDRVKKEIIFKLKPEYDVNNPIAYDKGGQCRNLEYEINKQEEENKKSIKLRKKIEQKQLSKEQCSTQIQLWKYTFNEALVGYYQQEVEKEEREKKASLPYLVEGLPWTYK